MPPVVAAAIATGIAGAGTAAIGAKAQSNASKRALQASERGAVRAEAFTREQDTQNRADEERRDAEDKRRWEIEQANIAREKSERDARQSYEDTIRYGKMVNLARLTGQPIPPRPNFSGAGDQTIASLSQPKSAPLMSRPSTANAMIAQPGAVYPMGANSHTAAAASLGLPGNSVQTAIPMSRLVGKRRAI